MQKTRTTGRQALAAKQQLLCAPRHAPVDSPLVGLGMTL